MNRAEIHQRALQAAAKATFSIAALGCGGPREPTGPATGSPATVEVPPASSQPAATFAAPVATAAPSARKRSCLSAGPPYSKEQVDCCALVVKNELSSQPELAQLSAEQDQCCRLLVEEGDAGRAPGKEVGLRFGDTYVCCSHLQPLPAGPTCMPWGPPTPPEMIAALLDERFA